MFDNIGLRVIDGRKAKVYISHLGYTVADRYTKLYSENGRGINMREGQRDRQANEKRK